MVFQGIRRIVGGADHPDAGPQDQVPGAEILPRKQCVAGIPDPLGTLRAEYLVNVKVTLELQMGPVIQGNYLKANTANLGF